MPLSFPGGAATATPKATNAVSGTVKTDVLNADPIVYLKESVDALIASSGGGGGSQTRQTVTYTSPVLAPQAKLDFSVTLGKRFDVLAINTSVAAWVRIYPNAAYRTSDTNRSINEQPSNDYVALVDIVSSSIALETFIIPNASCSNMESTPSPSIPCTVVNQHSAGATITINFIVVIKEN